ncbi:hypothetical protein [Lacihabitans sp. CCS-44]|uniref:hypothetical protein n=1 Tax=Lacihabitans sp. CCS-44 TaxID=2487331 RepID=UPI0020CCFD29|nr:hypothetical protein [Lacihabitans sp. CCS-44]
MFSKLIKLTFAITAYSPVILIWWLVSLYSIYNAGGTIGFINFSDFKLSDFFNKLNLVFIFVFLVLISWFILHLATTKLTRNSIEVKSIKSSDLNMNALIFTYFLPCIEIYKKDVVYLAGWCLALCIIVYINKGTYFHNPLMKLFGYSYYEIATKREVTYLMISKDKLKNPNEIKAYSQLTDFVLLDSSNK